LNLIILIHCLHNGNIDVRKNNLAKYQLSNGMRITWLLNILDYWCNMLKRLTLQNSFHVKWYLPVCNYIMYYRTTVCNRWSTLCLTKRITSDLLNLWHTSTEFANFGRNATKNVSNQRMPYLHSNVVGLLLTFQSSTSRCLISSILLTHNLNSCCCYYYILLPDSWNQQGSTLGCWAAELRRKNIENFEPQQLDCVTRHVWSLAKKNKKQTKTKLPPAGRNALITCNMWWDIKLCH